MSSDNDDLDQVIDMLSLTPSINNSNIRSTFDSFFEENEDSISLLLSSAMEGKPLNFSVEGYGDENSIKTTTSKSISKKDILVTYTVIETITIPNIDTSSTGSVGKKNKIKFDSKTTTFDESYAYHESIETVCDLFIKDIYSIDRLHDKRTAFMFNIVAQLYDLRERYIACPADVLHQSMCNLLCVALD